MKFFFLSFAEAQKILNQNRTKSNLKLTNYFETMTSSTLEVMVVTKQKVVLRHLINWLLSQGESSMLGEWLKAALNR